MSRTTSRTPRTSARRLAATSVGALALTLIAAPALAVGPAATDAPEPSGGTVTITVDAAALAKVCDERVPRVTERATALLARIQGDAGTEGSAAWLAARADKAAAQGHDDLARRLQFRADQRLGHVDEITTLLDELATFDANVCSQVAP